jgi:glyoxylase-like metal-dependent hydrolase (beta-lactamase superfamily II)
MVASGGDAAVIDPSVTSDVYLDIARQGGWSIRYVLETHLHADHLSRARDLAQVTGAVLLLPPQDRARFAFTSIADGQRVRLGDATLRAIHTPGHTNESTSYVLNDAAVFTGDTLFTNGVGHPLKIARWRPDQPTSSRMNSPQRLRDRTIRHPRTQHVPQAAHEKSRGRRSTGVADGGV